MRLIHCLLFLIVMVIAPLGCSSKNHIDPSNPKSVLTHYFELLVKEDYDSIVDYYGGSYEELQGYAPKIDSKDKSALFLHYIQVTGGQVVRINSIVEEKEVFPGQYEYKVTFRTPDGKLFRDGQVYVYKVNKINGNYKVMDLPPYVA